MPCVARLDASLQSDPDQHKTPTLKICDELAVFSGLDRCFLIGSVAEIYL